MAKINISRVADHFMNASLRKRATAGFVIQNAWKRRARSELTGGRTKTEYIQNIQLDLSSPEKVICRLVGFLPNLREHGMGPGGIGTQGPYDVRKFLLKPKTNNIRTAKGGHLYLHVPFDHTFKKMPPRVKKGLSAQALATSLQGFLPSTSAPGQGTNFGSRLPAGLSRRKRARDVRVRDHFGRFTKFIQRAHATDLHAGMVRMKKEYSEGSGSTFRTFRTVSENGKPWISRGVKAANIAPKVVRDLPNILRTAGII